MNNIIKIIVFLITSAALAFFSIIGNAQSDAIPGFPEQKQEMIKLGLQYDSAWDLYQSFEKKADRKILEANNLPDWRGLWEHLCGAAKYDCDTETGDYVERDFPSASLKGEYLEMMQEIISLNDEGFLWDPGGECGVARGYPGMLKNGRPHEFAVTPHQTWHLGQARNEVRRIYTDGRGHVPEDWAYDTEHGDSIGFWDGDKLVTHTMYTDGGRMGRMLPHFSNQLQGTEIWKRVDEDTIQGHVWIYDAEALEEPWYTLQVYKRLHQEVGQPLRLQYWWNCQSPNNKVVITEDGGTTFLDLDFTDMDDLAPKEDTQ
jgi:hypothetical protein